MKTKLFEAMSEAEIDQAARLLTPRQYRRGEMIFNQGDLGTECFIVNEGKCMGKVKTLRDFWLPIKDYEVGYRGYFGERALLRVEPRANAVFASSKEVRVYVLTKENYTELIKERDYKENFIRGAHLFETMTDDQVAKLASALERHTYAKDDKIIMQGEPGHHFFILEEGHAVAIIKNGDQPEQQVFEYQPGALFGEKALMENKPRAASIVAKTACKCYKLSRHDFEEKLGPLSQLTAEQYLADPRKLLADFYGRGDVRGPSGAINLIDGENEPDAAAPTDWFVVYRPCSRDSIAKMLGRIGVGKGLNIKGKSAKKNRLSGFVPFLQINENRHKKDIEDSPPNTRFHLYFRSEKNRSEAYGGIAKVLVSMCKSDDPKLAMDEPEIRFLDEYISSGSWGMDLPERLIKEAFIMRPDVSPMVGWETGRGSEPAFMDMNLHAVRGNSVPNVVLFQYDTADPMNPLGLLVAYAEAKVKPVVSDFDTFTVGSKGMSYQPTPDNQVELINWALGHLEDLLNSPDDKAWTSRWLEVLKKENERGFHPDLPKFGFGDPTSYALIGDVVTTTEGCGAVRHGAECFNFYFPQELDEDFLVIWDGYSDPPWKTLTEPELRQFLLERAAEGFSFPINPVWPVRDKGWVEVMKALRGHAEGRACMDAWFPPASGVQAKVEDMNVSYPKGFFREPKKNAAPIPLGDQPKTKSVFKSDIDISGESHDGVRPWL